MAFSFSLTLILLPTLLACIVILTIALYHWRQHPNFKNVMNFKRPHWLALFVSLGVTAFSYVTIKLFPVLFQFFKISHDNYNGIGFLFLFGLLTSVGLLASLLSSFFCLWHFIVAIFSYVHKTQNKKTIDSTHSNHCN